MKPVCVKCKLFFHVKKNSVAFEEGMPVRLSDSCKKCGNSKDYAQTRFGDTDIQQIPRPIHPVCTCGPHIRLGEHYIDCDCHDQNTLSSSHTFIPNDRWDAYKLWDADLWECKGCGAQLLLTGNQQQPVSEHYKPDYARMVEHFRPIIRVEDC